MRGVKSIGGMLALFAALPLAAQALPPATVAPPDFSNPPTQAAPPPSAPSPADLAAQPVDRANPVTTSASTPAPSTLKPVMADNTQPRVRSVIVFGSDPCPKASSPDEIVVCARQPDEDRYRIPPQLRTGQGVAVSNFTKDRSLLVQQAAGGAGGSIGSCSAVGPGGVTGCMQQEVDNWANPN